MQQKTIFVRFPVAVCTLAALCAGATGAYLSLPYKSVYVTIVFTGWSTIGAVVVGRSKRHHATMTRLPEVDAVTQLVA
ncbi:MAG: hypothetical protein EXQ64_02295 [Ilumatobacteraceae bacterium]|nr:hypothetical protein [Ilumatobacteraceae bacterium]